MIVELEISRLAQRGLLFGALRIVKMLRVLWALVWLCGMEVLETGFGEESEMTNRFMRIGRCFTVLSSLEMALNAIVSS
jgi:hypothetical protein